METRTCRECKRELPLEAFAKGQKHRDGRRSECRKCAVAYLRAYRRAHPEKVKEWGRRDREKRSQHRSDYARQWRYGISPSTYQKMLEAQGNVCAICGQPQEGLARGGKSNGRKKPLEVDHDHVTGHVRGLLCSPCNRLLALLETHAIPLQSVLDYLAAH